MEKITRIIDANLNRGREGLRVVEDIVRFLLDDIELAEKLKSARHEITIIAKQLPVNDIELINSRNSQHDVGKDIKSSSEIIRKDILQIATANIRRSQESMRVLEEISKLYNTKVSLEFKDLRYKLYELEKQVNRSLIKS
ncbi:MAG: thiamine-phosphate pyrophosphorylase [bacterium]